MEIVLYNTLTRRLDPLAPPTAGPFRMYTCGPTVYDFGHIGNFRTFVAVDILQRFLLTQGYELETVMNVTDIDDKMIDRSRAAGRPLEEYAAEYLQAFLEDSQRLRLLPPRHRVRATEHIAAMVAWIERLVAGGHAYAREGSVYFRVDSFAAYGRLSGKQGESLQAGARVDVDEYDKEAVRDFALWKAQRPGEPAWPSPWGPGRPGWHIECTVMAHDFLGDGFDLHAGGSDLIFPHHENEIAQAEAVTGRPFARHWMHCEFLLVNGEKMSKSTGNFFTVRDLVAKKYAPSAIRFLLASVPHRKPLNFTLEGLQQARAAVERLRAFRLRLEQEATPPGESPEMSALAAQADAGWQSRLADNLNTAEALAVLFELVRAGNTALDAGTFRAGNASQMLAVLAHADEVFQVLREDEPTGPVRVSAAEIEALLERREHHRQQREFAAADALRKQLDEAGVLVEDVKGGRARWRWKT